MGAIDVATARAAFTEAPAPTVIDLRHVTPDEQSLLSERGVSLEHVRRNFRATLGDWREDAHAFQLDAVRTGAIQAICPFTGRRTTTQLSFVANINTIFYRFATSSIFYIVVGGVGSGFKKIALYLPDHDLVLVAGDGWSFDVADVAELKARMVADFDLCRRYLARSCDRQTAICVGFYHFAHHLWNELPGLERLRSRGLLFKVRCVLVLREPLGPLEKIFPELQPEQILRCADTHSLFHQSLLDGLFVVRLGACFLPAEVTRRVHRVARTSTAPALADQIRRARHKSWPLLWIGIRVGDKSWIDQGQGLSELIEALHRDHPRLAVVFDGFSNPADGAERADDDLARLVAQETAVVDEVLARLKGQGVELPSYNIIGRPILEANLWAQAIHLYVSPYGSLQHKVGWLARKSGVVHSNTTLLHEPADHVWTSVQGARPPRYLSPAAVRDVDGYLDQRRYNETADASESGAGVLAINLRLKQGPAFANYSADPQAILKEVEALLQAPMGLDALAELTAEGVKRRVKTAVRAALALARTAP